VANRLLRQYAEAVGFATNFTILDQDDSRDLIKICLKDVGINPKMRRFPSPAVLQGIFSFARNSARSIEDVVEERYPAWMDILPDIQAVATAEERRKRSANAMDFDDLLLNFLELFYEHPSIGSVLTRRFRHVLVDEYQDINALQAQLVDFLSVHHKNLLVVGDDAQSIYSFRAAEIKNILQFPKTYPDAKIFRLEENYRSTPQILALANGIIAQNAGQYEKQLRAVHAGHTTPQVLLSDHPLDEARKIADRVEELQANGTPLSEMAVLFRAAFHSQALEMELTSRGIAYDYRGGVKFFERAHVKDVAAFLKLIENPKDALSWMRVLSFQVGIGPVTAMRIAEQAQTAVTIEEIFQLNLVGVLKGSTVDGWDACRGAFRLALLTDRSPAALIRAIAHSSYKEYVEAEYPNAEDRLEDIEQLARFAEEFTSLTDVLAELTLTGDGGGLGEAERIHGPDDEEKMILSTIHQAKGLEWDAVFVMRLVDGAFPNPRALEEDGGLEEERRLFYVAVTRARRELFLTYPLTLGRDTLDVVMPSVFLQELPKDLVQNAGVREVEI
jgi:DNA helicase-2/ATP-dependent DNA helicase PcrA